MHERKRRWCRQGECERAELVDALKAVAKRLGIRRDFCPLGIALELEPIIRSALKSADEDIYA